MLISFEGKTGLFIFSEVEEMNGRCRMHYKNRYIRSIANMHMSFFIGVFSIV